MFNDKIIYDTDNIYSISKYDMKDIEQLEFFNFLIRYNFKIYYCIPGSSSILTNYLFIKITNKNKIFNLSYTANNHYVINFTDNYKMKTKHCTKITELENFINLYDIKTFRKNKLKNLLNKL